MSNISIPSKERPPFVRFEEREHGTNPEASQRAGRPIPRVVTMVFVTSPGSKDEFTAIAEEWLAGKRQQAIQGNYNPEWVDMFERQYEAFKKGHELPRDGTPVQTWAAVTNEQRIRLKALGYTTIEDLAQVPDTGLAQIGLDGRYLRDLARTWITEGQDKGVNARALADANVTIQNQAAQIAAMQERQAQMEAQIQQLLAGQQPAAAAQEDQTDTPARRGRPRSAPASAPLG